jgi:hypothetical protein
MPSVPSTGSDPMAFTRKEEDAMRVTNHLLLTEFNLTEDKISNIILAIITMTCQCHPASAAEMCAKLLKLIDDSMGIKTFDEILNEIGSKGKKLVGSTYEARLANICYGEMTEYDISYD